MHQDQKVTNTKLLHRLTREQIYELTKGIKNGKINVGTETHDKIKKRGGGDEEDEEYKEWQKHQIFIKSLKNEEHYRATRETLEAIEKFLKKFSR